MYIYRVTNFILYQYIIMIPSRETLHPDSSVYQYSARENVVKKTDTAISKVFENEVKMSSAGSIIKKIQELNPEVEIEADFDRGIIYSAVNVEELILPQ